MTIDGRDVAGRAGVDRSSGGGVHGVAVRRLGDQSRRVFRDGLGSAARESARREGAVRASSDTPRRPRAACWCSRDARCRPTTWRRGLRAKAGIAPSALTFAVAPTASLAGGVQIVARVDRDRPAQDGHARLRRRREVVSAIGTAPLPPMAKSDMRAIGRTNDCVLYGAQARYTVRAEDDELAALAERLPSSASADYGTPFYDIFKRYDNDFYKIDPMLFSPAEVWLTSATSGRTFHAGRLNPDVLRASFA